MGRSLNFMFSRFQYRVEEPISSMHMILFEFFCAYLQAVFLRSASPLRCVCV